MRGSLSFARMKAELHPDRLKAKHDYESLKEKVWMRSRQIPEQVNTQMLEQLRADSGDTTFVLDTNLACIFKTLKKTGDRTGEHANHRKIFLDFLLSVKLGAPPATMREYAAFGAPCSIPFSRIPEREEACLEDVVDDLLKMSKTRKRDFSSRKRRLGMDYKIVLQSAFIYPKCTILTNDWDLWFFKLKSIQIEDLLYRRYPTLWGVGLHSVSLVNVAADLGLRLR